MDMKRNMRIPMSTSNARYGSRQGTFFEQADKGSMPLSHRYTSEESGSVDGTNESDAA